MIAFTSSTQLQIRPASAEELRGWDSLVRRFPNRRVVHTLAWIRSLEASGFGKPEYLVLEREGSIVACLPGLISEIGPLRLFGSPPPASQTVSMGPAFDDQRVTPPEIMEIVLPYLEQRRGI